MYSVCQAVGVNSDPLAAWHLSPCTDKAHEKGTKEDEEAGVDSLLSTENTPALIAQEILREQLDQRSKGKQTGGDGVHHSHHDQAHFRAGAVEGVSSQTESLAKGSSIDMSNCLIMGRTKGEYLRAAVCKCHEPGLHLALRPLDARNSRTEC